MEREIDLEDLDEYFLMSPEDRQFFMDQIEERLNAWQPRMRFYIENTLKYANNPKYKNREPEQAAIDLIQRCANQEPVQCLRREFAKEDSPARTHNLVILIEAVSRNCHLDFTKRFTTIKFYVNNPRYVTNGDINDAIACGLEVLQYEAESYAEDIQATIQQIPLST